MKHLHLAGLLAATMFAASAPVAQALTYNDGDLFLAFRATGNPGSTTDYIVDIGPASNFVSGGSAATGTGASINIGNIATDLAATFGSSWATRPDLLWSVSGVQITGTGSIVDNTAFATKAEATVGTTSTPWARQSIQASNVTATYIQGVGQEYAFGSTNDFGGGLANGDQLVSSNNAKALFQPTTRTNSYAYFQPGGAGSNASQAYLTYTNGIEGSFGNGVAGTALDLFAMAPSSTNPKPAGSVLGVFSLDASGNLTFTSPSISGPTVAFEHSTYSVSEANGSVSMNLIRAGDLTGSFTVNYSTQNGTATAGTDYTAQTNGSVSFTASQTTKAISIPITNRSGFQSSRSFTVNLSVTSGATVVSPGSTTVTITDTSANPNGTIAFTKGTYAFGNEAISLARTGGTTGAVSVAVEATGGTLVSGTDFDIVTTPISFAAGVTSGEVSLKLKSSATSKLPATIILALDSPTGGADVGTQGTATINVASPVDTALPVVKVTSPKAGSVTGTFNITGAVTEARGVDHVAVSINGVTQNAPLGTPAAGQTTFEIDNIAPQNGKNTIIVQAFDFSGNASAKATIAVTYINPVYAAKAGAYNGLLVPAVTPTNNLSGFVNITLTSTGAFTGKVTLGGAVLAITGIFDNAGAAHFNPALGTTYALTTKQGTVVVPLGTLALNTAAGQINGTLKDPVVTTTTDANITTDRVFFDGKTPATTMPTAYTANKGIYNVIIPSKTQTGSPALTTYPQGDGIATITVTTKGVATLKGTLADGTIISAAAPISASLHWPFFVQLYTKLGSIGGQVTLDNTQTDSDLKATNLLWFKPAGLTSQKYYPNGWPNSGLLKVDLLGANFVPPVTKAPTVPILSGLKPVDTTNGNVALEFSDGQLGTSPLNKNANIDPATAKASVTTVTVNNKQVLDPTLTFAVTATSGAVAGTFVHLDASSVSTKPAYKALIFQKGPSKGAFGYFLSLPKAPATGESGGVTLTVKP